MRLEHHAAASSEVDVQGFNLIEVVVALGIVTFVLVSILGLFSIGLNQTRESEQTMDAANLAALIMERRLASPFVGLPALDNREFAGNRFGIDSVTNMTTLSNLPVSPSWMTNPFPVGGSGYELTPADDLTGAYRMIYALWRDTNGNSNSRVIKLHLLLTAPYAALPTNATTRYEVVTSYLVP